MKKILFAGVILLSTAGAGIVTGLTSTDAHAFSWIENRHCKKKAGAPANIPSNVYLDPVCNCNTANFDDMGIVLRATAGLTCW